MLKTIERKLNTILLKILKKSVIYRSRLWDISLHEPPHDKTNKMTVRPAKTQISRCIRPVWSESLLCAQWVAKDQSFLHADWADLSLRWAHMTFCWFCHEAAQLWLFLNIVISLAWLRHCSLKRLALKSCLSKNIQQKQGILVKSKWTLKSCGLWSFQRTCEVTQRG